MTTVTIPNTVTNISSGTFYNCSSLTEVTIPEFVTSIGSSAFKGCKGLTSITIPNFVTSIGNSAFDGCSGLTSVVIPNSVTSIGSHAFYGCSGLTSITISNSVTSIGDYAFDGCSSLISVAIPNTITSIGNGAFYRCTRLKSITIPESVTSIGNYAFNGCKGLTSITIPNSVTSIGDNAFYNCSGLTSIACDGTVAPTMGFDAFRNVNSSVKVCVPGNYSSDKFGVFSVCKGLVHDNATEPTCTESGKTEGLHCSGCGKVYIAQEETAAALGHAYGTPTYEWNEDNTTCTATKVCANNSEHVVTETSNATSAVTVAATCEAVGTRTFTAEFAGESFATQQTTEEIPATGHSNSTAVTAPTCTEVGFTTHNCTVCDYTYNSDTVAATGHKADSIVFKNVVAATCTAAGSKDSVVYCSVCQNELLRETKEISATGHTEVADAAVAATCTAASKTEGKHCSVCNETIVAQTEIAALGHEFKDYVYNNDATITADGTETAICTRGCGATDTRTAAGTKLAETPEKGTAVAESAAPAITIYAHHNIIVVENAIEEISVYNAMGTLICRDATPCVRTEINVNAPGIYIVKVGGTAKRVMVNQ